MSTDTNNATRGDDCLVLSVHTRQQPDFHKPPQITRRPGDGQYVGYFENACGELWVVVIDRRSRTGWLSGHETGWERVPIDHGEVQADLILNTEESRWLDACWRAATGDPMRPGLIEALMACGGLGK